CGDAARRRLSERATVTARRMGRSYRTAPDAIYDHFRPSRDLHPLQTTALQRLQQVGAAGQARKPRWKDDHVIRADLADEADHAVLAVTAVGQDLRRHQAHEVDDLSARDPGDGADVVEGQARARPGVGGHPVPEADLHRL